MSRYRTAILFRDQALRRNTAAEAARVAADSRTEAAVRKATNAAKRLLVAANIPDTRVGSVVNNVISLLWKGPYQNQLLQLLMRIY